MKKIQQILWRLRILRSPIENVPAQILKLFKIGLLNTFNNNKKLQINSYGEVINTDECPDAIEFFLPWKFLQKRNLTRRDAYDLMGDFSNSLVIYLTKKNQTVIPVVNFGSWMSLPNFQTRRRISWHSRGSTSGHLHLKAGTFAEHVSIDEAGFGGWSSFTKNMDFKNEDANEAKKYFENFSKNIIDNHISKYSQPNTKESAAVGDYLFFPMQMPGDMVADLAWIDTLSLLKLLGEVSDSIKEKILVKRHPKCTSREVTRVIRKMNKHSNIIFTDGNIHDLISGSKAVITVNSGVGAEALLHRKPVIATGASDYVAASISVKNINELRHVLSHQITADNKLIEKFISYYSQKYMIPLDNTALLESHPTLNRFINREGFYQ